MKSILPFIALLLAAGCAFHSENSARNEVNEPLFHTSTYFAVGAQTRLLSGGEVNDSGWRFDWSPCWRLEAKVNRWSSFNGLPINWNFLLTGEQYDDSTILKVGKLHAIATGGLLGFSYSSADGFMLPANLKLVGKYLFTPRLFATADLGGSTFDILGLHGITWESGLKLGFQAWEPVSIGVQALVLRDQLASGWSIKRDDVLFRDDDLSLYSGVSVRAYPTSRNILEVASGYRRKNPGSNATGQTVFSATYRYVL